MSVPGVAGPRKARAVDTLRCPTCLSVLLESTAERCPTCRTKLGTRRAEAIVLGETGRLDVQAGSPITRKKRNRLLGGYWNAERPAPTPAPEPVAWFDEPEAEALSRG